MYDTNITYRKPLENISQVAFLLKYGAVRVFNAISVVDFNGIVRREWGRRTFDFSLITNTIYQFIFKDNKSFFMDHRCTRNKFRLV